LKPYKKSDSFDGIATALMGESPLRLYFVA